MPQIQEDEGPDGELAEAIYLIIRANSGKVTTKYLEKKIGNRETVRYAITRLTLQGRIKRVKGFGTDKIEYYYHDNVS